jgi:transposase InsO family protein
MATTADRAKEQYRHLDKIYYNPQKEGSYGGVERLLRDAKAEGLNISRDVVESYLRDQASYSLHKPARKNFKRNQTVVGGIDQQWQADLADMQQLSKFNNGFRYLLTVIDVFSKFAWVIPVRNKSATDIAEAFKELFKSSAPRKPKKIQTDAGKEFLNSDVQKLFKSKSIQHFVSDSDKKAAVVERFNRTIQDDWIDWHIQDLKDPDKFNHALMDYLIFYNTQRVHFAFKNKLSPMQFMLQ